MRQVNDFLRVIVCFLCYAAITHAAAAQTRTDSKLEKKIAELVKGFHGDVGVYVKNLHSGKVSTFQADTIFPTASMVKIPIMVGMMDKIEKGELSYHQEIIYKDSLLYAGSDILGSYKTDEKIEIGKTMLLMLSTSDNTASLWLQSLAGGGTRINELLDSAGLKDTRVNSRTPGREENRKMYGWGQTTPREMATLVEKISKGEIISPKASEKMLRLLSRNYDDENAISQIPPYVFIACKHGCVNQSRSETLFVMAPHGAYVFSIITKNQQDQSWQPSNEGWALARNLSSLLWHYFEPKSKWIPK